MTQAGECTPLVELRHTFAKQVLLHVGAIGAVLIAQRVPVISQYLWTLSSLNCLTAYLRPQQVIAEGVSLGLQYAAARFLGSRLSVAPPATSALRLFTAHDNIVQGVVPSRWRYVTSFVVFSNPEILGYYATLQDRRNVGVLALWNGVRSFIQGLVTCGVRVSTGTWPVGPATTAMLLVYEGLHMVGISYAALSLTARITSVKWMRNSPGWSTVATLVAYTVSVLTAQIATDFLNAWLLVRLVDAVEGFSEPVEGPDPPASAFAEFANVPGPSLSLEGDQLYAFATTDKDVNQAARVACVKRMALLHRYINRCVEGAIPRTAPLPLTLQKSTLIASQVGRPEGKCAHCGHDGALGDTVYLMRCGHQLCKGCGEGGYTVDWCPICRACCTDPPDDKLAELQEYHEQRMRRSFQRLGAQISLPWYLYGRDWIEVATWCVRHGILTRFEVAAVPFDFSPGRYTAADYFLLLLTCAADVNPLDYGLAWKIARVYR